MRIRCKFNDDNEVIVYETSEVRFNRKTGKLTFIPVGSHKVIALNVSPESGERYTKELAQTGGTDVINYKVLHVSSPT